MGKTLSSTYFYSLMRNLLDSEQAHHNTLGVKERKKKLITTHFNMFDFDTLNLKQIFES